MNNQEESKETEEKKQEVNIAIEVSRDKLEAFITLVPLKEGPALDLEELKSALSFKGIIFGIQKEVLEALGKEPKYEQRILIASGVRPQQGKDGRVDSAFTGEGKVRVSKGDKLAEIFPPEDGVEGIDVFAQKIPVRKTKEALQLALVNVEQSPDNAKILVAKVDGYVFMDQVNLAVEPFFELECTEDEMEAYVKVRKPLSEQDFGAADLKRFLDENGLAYGILEEEIENIFKQVKFDRKVLIARGKKVVDDTDGVVRYYFETETRHRLDDEGKMDFRELNLIQNVKKGDKLAEVIPPEKGEEGQTVFGKKIEPKPGHCPSLPSGENTAISADNENVLAAQIDGNVSLKKDKVEVQPVFMVKGSIDYAVGNIDFQGSVIINGDIKSGFKVRSKGDVQVDGVVEDAFIEAGGNVMLKTGFVGRGQGKITAQGEVTAKFCEKETIVSEGDIYVSEYVMHSSIQTRGRLIVTEKAGVVVGGEIYALQGVEAKVIGNRNYAPTSLFVGMDKETSEKIKEKKTFLQENLEQLKKLEKALFKYDQLKLLKVKLDPDKQAILEKVKLFKVEKTEELRQLAAEIKGLEDQAEEFKNAVVKVYDTVYPGTTITIHNRHAAVAQPAKAVCYRYADQGITADPLVEGK